MPTSTFIENTMLNGHLNTFANKPAHPWLIFWTTIPILGGLTLFKHLFSMDSVLRFWSVEALEGTFNKEEVPHRILWKFREILLTALFNRNLHTEGGSPGAAASCAPHRDGSSGAAW